MQKSRFLTVLASSVRAPSLAAALALVAVGGVAVSTTALAAPPVAKSAVAQASAGQLDASFGRANDGTPDGIVNLSLGDGNDTSAAVAVQADGKMVVVGTSTSTSTSTVSGTTSSNMVVQRFLPDGTLDVTFGVGTNDGSPDGVVTLSLGDGEEHGHAVAVQPDGKIVVVGTTTSTQDKSSNIVVARLLPNGQLDTSFGKADDGAPDGVVNLSLGKGNDAGNAVALQADGKIVVVGTNTDAGSSNMAVVRLTKSGELDKTFGVGTDDGTPDGVVSLSLGDGNDAGNAVALQADGKVVVVGTTTSTDKTSNIVVARLLPNGQLDTSFGKANDGTPDGVVNLSLGDGNDTGNAVALQADGKIVVAGTNTDAGSSNIAVVRLTKTGALDKTFGVGQDDGTPDGVVSLSLGKGDDVASAVAVQADGKVVVAGTTTSTDKTSNVVVVRLQPNGKLDGRFGQDADGTPDGVVNLSLGDGNDTGRALALQADGKIVVAADRVNGNSTDIALVRLLGR
ncbi:MAG: hypothetical protein PHW78_00045 [Macromonas bipunctata]|nr:hypothetical protein [Macromonas bipunctata]